ncbi:MULTISPECIES: hypothetical protein [Massilia]|uniref:Uncharacterized protein n=1 Tax=Massilia aurea TaxID=373040 RepID=A0A422QQS0_9BURK|nr:MULTISPECIES: hypothetical protein [Massilia]MDY0961156.1 hypothetical protein [Massilia sp. CFBP9026]RNF32344.1 hypothetical protein NM04_02310 [Massilia aurea]
MSAYREWFRFDVEHAYHGGRFGGWRALPDEPTGRLLKRAGALMRQVDDGVVVLVPERDWDLLPAQDDADLVFEVRVDDPLFGTYTFLQPERGQALLADSRQAVREPSGAWRLHAGELLGEEALAPDLPRQPGAPRPALLLRIAPQDAAESNSAPRYVVRLGAAASHWKYYLMDGLAERALSIVDLDDEVEFRRVDGAGLDGRKAAVFVSDRALALRARSARRFQLREQAAFGDKVLVKRLPVACAGIRRKAEVDGHAVLVSEIFVNY